MQHVYQCLLLLFFLGLICIWFPHQCVCFGGQKYTYVLHTNHSDTMTINAQNYNT